MPLHLSLPIFSPRPFICPPCRLRLQPSQRLPQSRLKSTISPRPSSSAAPPKDDYYALVLSQPLQNPHTPSKRPSMLPNPPPLSSSASTLPTTTKDASPSTPQQRARLIFSSRLVGPRYIPSNDGTLASRPSEPENCCMSGCVDCVWDRYREELEGWVVARKERDVDAGSGGNGGMRGGDEVGDLDTEWRDDGIFGDLPVGIREFMRLEKMVRERGRERERGVVE